MSQLENIMNRLRLETNAERYLEGNKGIITLVGSTRFYDEYVSANRQLTLKGWVVLSCGHFGNSRHKHLDNPVVNEDVKKLHYYKLSLSDAVCLVHPSYIGNSTQRELEFTEKLGLALLEARADGLDHVKFSMADKFIKSSHYNYNRPQDELYDSTMFQHFAREGLGY